MAGLGMDFTLPSSANNYLDFLKFLPSHQLSHLGLECYSYFIFMIFSVDSPQLLPSFPDLTLVIHVHYPPLSRIFTRSIAFTFNYSYPPPSNTPTHHSLVQLNFFSTML